MKILAVSDIHGNVRAARQVRARESNHFDVIVVAGDIGNDKTAEILAILASFECPVLYVYGNWDHETAYDQNFGPTCHHLHMAPYQIQGTTFIGYSGVEQNWGRNPIARKFARKGRQFADIGAANRSEMVKDIRKGGYDPRSTIVVTHDRLYRTNEDMPDVPLFLFGHRHGFYDREFKGSRFVNVSVLDDPVSVAHPDELDKNGWDAVFNINDGNYTILEWSKSAGTVARKMPFKPSFAGWEFMDGIFMGAPWIGDELVDQ